MVMIMVMVTVGVTVEVKMMFTNVEGDMVTVTFPLIHTQLAKPLLTMETITLNMVTIAVVFQLIPVVLDVPVVMVLLFIHLNLVIQEERFPFPLFEDLHLFPCKTMTMSLSYHTIPSTDNALVMSALDPLVQIP